MTISTTDLCDAHEDRFDDLRLRVLDPDFLAWGAREEFAGPAATLKLFEDNSLVRSSLEQPGAGRVLVVDAGGSFRCAVVGGNLAALGARNGWAGIVVNGCVRDTRELDEADIGVRALATHPRRSAKKGTGERDVPVTFSGVTIRPGDWIYADADGILVSDEALTG